MWIFGNWVMWIALGGVSYAITDLLMAWSHVPLDVRGPVDARAFLSLGGFSIAKTRVARTLPLIGLLVAPLIVYLCSDPRTTTAGTAVGVIVATIFWEFGSLRALKKKDLADNE